MGRSKASTAVVGPLDERGEIISDLDNGTAVATLEPAAAVGKIAGAISANERADILDYRHLVQAIANGEPTNETEGAALLRRLHLTATTLQADISIWNQAKATEAELAAINVAEQMAESLRATEANLREDNQGYSWSYV